MPASAPWPPPCAKRRRAYSRRRARAAHPYGHADPVYTGAAALVVEGALPFTVFSLAYLVAYALGSDVANAFSFYAMFTVSEGCFCAF